MKAADKYPNLDYLLGQIFDSAGSLKKEFQDDGQLDPDEIVSSIPNPAVQEYIRGILTAVKELPGEVESLTKSGPWVMMQVLPELLISRVMAIFK